MSMKPRIIVVGAGHLGTYHLQKTAADASVQLVGVVDVNAASAQKAADRFGVAASASLKDFCGKADAAIVATPTVTHMEVVLQALAANMDVLVEKPIAVSSAQARRMLEAAATAAKILAVGHTERFNPAMAAGLRIADRPRYIVAERLGRFSGRSTDVDVILDLMIHDLDIVASLVPADVREIRAIGVPVLTHETDMASARIEFSDGTVAQLSAGRASLEGSRKVRLFTQERYVSIDCASGEVKSVRRLPPQSGNPWPQITGEVVEVETGDALALQDHHFFTCVRTRENPRVDGAAGLRALELAEAVKSAMTIPHPLPA